jgi:hypothetical protein
VGQFLPGVMGQLYSGCDMIINISKRQGFIMNQNLFINVIVLVGFEITFLIDEA